MTRENAVDIICIGAQRAMTSWLHSVISAHPGTWAFPDFRPITSTNKEAHFWDRNHQRGQNWYRVLMRPLADDLKSLDFTPEYAFLGEAHIEECRRLNPSAKVIYILRDPLARAISALRMHSMWDTHDAAEDGYSLAFGEEFLGRCERARLAEHGDYVANARRWQRHYPDLILLNYESLAAAPREAARQILQSCGLDSDALEPDRQAQIDAQAERINWPARRYPLSADCVHFLHGLTWATRRATEQELGIRFSEGEGFLGQPG